MMVVTGEDFIFIHGNLKTMQYGGAWDFCFSGVSTANRLIYQFQILSQTGQVNADVAAAYVAELQTLRGFFYWQLVDLYGNVPIVH